MQMSHLRSGAAKGIWMMRINWLLLPLVLLGCNTYRSNAGYFVTDITHVAMTNDEIYAKTGEKFFCNENERCTVVEVTISHDGHTIKAVCQLSDPQHNACNQIEVGKSYGFTRQRGASMDFLSLENPHMVLTVEEEHDNSR